MPVLVLLAAAWISGPAPAGATGIEVGAGSSLSLGSGSIDLGCGDLLIAAGGAVDGGAGSLTLGGAWSNAGSFTAGTSSVEVDDSCAPGAAMLLGDTAFFALSAATVGGLELQIETGSTQSFASSLALQGGPGGLLTLRSTSPGNEAFFDLASGGAQSISYVDVADNHAIGEPLAPGPPSDFDSVDSGNSLGWFLRGVNEIPTLGAVGLTFLVLLLITAALRRLRPAGF